MSWLQLSSIVLLKQILGHTLKSFLVLRNVLVDVFNLTRLYGLLGYFLDFNGTSLSTLSILLVVLLTKNLNLRWNRVVAYVILAGIVLFILSQEILKIPVALPI